MQITLFTPEGMKEGNPADLPKLLTDDTATFWVDMTGPGADDITMMRDVFNFHPLAIEDTRNHKQRPKLEEYSGYVFIIVNPITSLGDDLDFRELDIFVGRNYVVTVHAEAEPVIDSARQRLGYIGQTMTMTVSYLTYVLLDIIVDGYFPIVDRVESEIDELEDQILENPKPEALNRLFELKRMLLAMWRIIWPQRDILSVLVQPHILNFGNDRNSAQYYIRDVSDHLLWIADMVSTFRDTLTSIIDLYMSAVSNRLNQTVNRLTVFTLVIGVMTVISGFYGMNFDYIWPAHDAPWAVPFVLALMLFGSAGVLYILRRVGRE
jgi:magnesium transporter